MKSTLKLIVAAGLCAAVVYSCKTNSVQPATTTSTQSVASQIALSLSKSFQGANGGANINQGIKSPYAVSHKGPAINGIYDLCGTGTDTTFNNTTLHHDTTVVFTGGLKFVYDCGSAGVNGYHVIDSLNSASANATFFNSSTNVQKYIVKALDATYKLISIDGSISTTNHVSTLSGQTTTEYHDLVSKYIFNGVTADVSGAVGDFLTGTASYTTTQTDFAARYGNATNVTVYHGLITYLGNHKATISIQINGVGNTDTYSVDMITGAMAKI
jgi:hypothetical protein